MLTRKMLPRQITHELLLDSSGTAWGGLPIVWSRACSAPYIRRSVTEVPTLALTSHGRSEVRWRTKTGDKTDVWDETRLTFLARGCELEHIQMAGSIEGFGVVLDPLMLASWTGAERSDGALMARHLPAHIVDRDAHLLSLMKAMATEIEHGCPSGPLYAQSMSIALASYFWGRFASSSPPAKNSAIPPWRLDKLKAFMRDNIGNDITLDTLAYQVGMTPKHFAESFKRSCGVSPYQCFLQMRIDEAKSALSRHGSSITQIAMDFGFANPSHFSAAFRKAVGVSPREFRSLAVSRQREPMA